ncbi:hypothetical protein [Rhodohalobacter sp. 614A]|uniref:hypothetical protein n=1 Tax=Rhodohalobacter sp. 614A TaxID=2908649 RepID=UPI001F39B83E|nr:hypothetical protein [Rhodohalobacter sp. 614A]
MISREQHIANLQQTEDWISYLEKHSGLPGPRSNLELLAVVMDTGDEAFFKTCLAYNETVAPTNTPGEFVAACGTAGLGKLICEGKSDYWQILRNLASDSRWRIREGVAFALQRIGQNDFISLIENLRKWSTGNPYEKRAVVAGLCEPVLLKDLHQAQTVLDIIQQIIVSIKTIPDRKNEPFRVLKKGLGYGLSVAMAACPAKGKELFESLLNENDPDIRWILKENLKKNRLVKMDPEWTVAMKNIASAGS